MGYIEGTSREQVMMLTFDDMVAEDSTARLIDRFVEVCDLKKLGFNHTDPEQSGRPPYHPGSMAKLYVYGYETSVRSSRKLEKETQRNVEVMWLMDGLKPDHKTIAEFRRQNIRPLQKLFREFVLNHGDGSFGLRARQKPQEPSPWYSLPLNCLFLPFK